MTLQPGKPSLEELRAALRRAGLRATPARIAVLGVLTARGRPMSHAEVVDALEGEARDPTTLYRNLVDLAGAGVLRRTDLGDRVWRFAVEAGSHRAFDHPHFVCTDCGRVLCLPGAEVRVAAPGEGPASVRDGQVEVQVRGVCDECGRETDGD